MTSTTIDGDPHSKQCPACGSQTSLGSTQCLHCGAIVQDSTGQIPTASQLHFLQELFARSNPFTMIFIGINVGVFVLMCLAGGFAVTSVDQQVLLGFGAKQNTLITEQHEYWRLITSIFIHIGIIHLFLNNYALWIIGQEIERIYGSARFVVLYLATGIAGSVGSYVFNPQATSAGASGAIFGLFGVMAAFAFRYRKEIPEFLSRDIKRRVLPVIAINLIFGFSVRIVDNAAHIGGLLAGIVLALLVSYMRPQERVAPLIWRALQVICIAVMLISFVQAFRGYNGPALRLAKLFARDAGPNVAEYFDRMQGTELYFEKALETFPGVLAHGGGGSDRAAAPGTTGTALEQALYEISKVPRIEPEADRYQDQLLQLINEEKGLLKAFETRTDRESVMEREHDLNERYARFTSEYNKWLPGFLKRFGYELRGRKDQ